MQASRRNRTIVAIIAAHAAARVAALVLAERGPRTVDWFQGFPQALSISQAALLATWLALGKSRNRIRKTAMLLAANGALEALSRGEFVHPASLLRSVLLSSLGIVFIAALAEPWARLRRRGFELIDFGHAPPAGEGAGQFSLRQVIAWTTVIALLLALGQWTSRLGEIDSAEIRMAAEFILALLVIGSVLLLLVGVMLFAGRAVLSPGDFRSRLALSFAAALLLGCLFPYYAGSAARGYAHSAGVSVCYVAILFGSFLPIRLCGFRLVRSGGT